ncbi:MAG: formate dehydrogenase accessory sulfurtransferase FdhD [Syntrophomonadaceae bacterium]|jgi:FdhD protein
MAMSTIYKHRSTYIFNERFIEPAVDSVVLENCLEIYINDEEIIKLACSPNATKELAVGYLISEGIIQSFSDLEIVEATSNGNIKIQLRKDIREKARFINTGNGKMLCAPYICKHKVPMRQVFKCTDILKMITELDDTSTTFKITGGVHSAGLGENGKLLVRYEDIGRHNAVDKVFGYAFLHRITLENKCLVLSGRVASEILLKAACNNIPLIISRSAPTYRAIEMAEEIGITIIGFARGSKFTIYCHEKRIVNEK